ncbi:MAG: hypothetical protein D6717_12075 [Gammaproteobacteria bacterium]|nr:MAG: hypothetical protein D6717_12075 [Gammaproteobacteria bacterium]
MSILTRGVFEVKGLKTLGKDARARLAEELEALFPGMDLKARWVCGLGNRECLGATTGRLRVEKGGQLALQLDRRAGLVDFEYLTAEQAKAMIDTLERHGLEVEKWDSDGKHASQANSLLLMMLYVAAFALFFFPMLYQRNESLAWVMSGMLVFSIVGGILLQKTAGQLDSAGKGRAGLGMLMFMPGVLFLAPWSFLLVPMFKSRLRLNFVRQMAGVSADMEEQVA